MPNVLFYCCGLAVTSAIMEVILNSYNPPKKEYLIKKLLKLGVGIGTIYILIRILPVIANELKNVL
jgi:hypothetical protein